MLTMRQRDKLTILIEKCFLNPGQSSTLVGPSLVKLQRLFTLPGPAGSSRRKSLSDGGALDGQLTRKFAWLDEPFVAPSEHVAHPFGLFVNPVKLISQTRLR
jgi:hypothetical protein